MILLSTTCSHSLSYVTSCPAWGQNIRYFFQRNLHLQEIFLKKEQQYILHIITGTNGTVLKKFFFQIVKLTERFIGARFALIIEFFVVFLESTVSSASSAPKHKISKK